MNTYARGKKFCPPAQCITHAYRQRLFAHVLLITILFAFLCAASAQKTTDPKTSSISTDTNVIKAEMDTAIHQVEKIVNQPVSAFRRTAGMRVGAFKEGWFHPGAIKPDFDKVNVRIYQETNYAKYDYVSSDLNPGIVFRGADLEFNSMTKYFYTNRNLPKKKLTGPEMEEINRLYRIIGRCEHQLSPPAAADAMTSDTAATEAAATPGAPSGGRSVFLNPWIGGSLIVGLILVVLFNRLSRA